MRRWVMGVAIAACAMTGPAYARVDKLFSIASNGVVITFDADVAADLYEYNSPPIDLSMSVAETGFVMAYRDKRAGKLDELLLLGAFNYPGAWRRYNSAVFLDGAPARLQTGNHSSGTCPGGPCTLDDEIAIPLSPAEIAAHGRDGQLTLQLRTADAQTKTLHIPLSYLDALNEVASEP